MALVRFWGSKKKIVEGQLSQAPVAMNVTRDSVKMKLLVTRSTYMVIDSDPCDRNRQAMRRRWNAVVDDLLRKLRNEHTKINGKTYWICLLRPVADQF